MNLELPTDHKALEEIRKQSYFKNHWIERIQENIKGDAEALSRQRWAGKSKQLQKIKKHVIFKNAKEYLEFDDGTQRVEDQRNILSVEPMILLARNEGERSRILKECETCQSEK